MQTSCQTLGVFCAPLAAAQVMVGEVGKLRHVGATSSVLLVKVFFSTVSSSRSMFSRFFRWCRVHFKPAEEEPKFCLLLGDPFATQLLENIPALLSLCALHHRNLKIPFGNLVFGWINQCQVRCPVCVRW